MQLCIVRGIVHGKHHLGFRGIDYHSLVISILKVVTNNTGSRFDFSPYIFLYFHHVPSLDWLLPAIFSKQTLRCLNSANLAKMFLEF